MSLAAELERAVALYKSGKINDAISSCRKLAEQNPEMGAAHANLGVMLHGIKKLKEAFAHLQKAHELEPLNPLFCLNLANLLRDIAEYEKAILLLERAVQQKPDYASAWLNLGVLYKDVGLAEKSSACFHQALKLKPDFQEAASNYAYSLLFLPSSTPEQIYEAHIDATKYEVRSTKFEVFSSHLVPRTSHFLKLGFVSGDFREHPAAYFTIGTIEWLAKNGTQVFLYANQLEGDALTHRFKASGTYRTIYGMPDDEVAKLITQDGVDILFDLTGHNARGRLGVFARKPAAVQITWAGYMATTGLPQIDFIIGDKWHMKSGDEKFYIEKIIRLPSSFICFDTPTSHPVIQSSSHPLTLGCFNIPVKINDNVVKIWAEILKQIPDAKLLLKAKQYTSKEAKERIAKLFADCGISSEHIEFIAGTSREKHLEALSAVDVSLDPFPFSGSTTTLESLYMGTPVITLPGNTMASRHSESFLRTLGLDELIAINADDYVEKAVHLATNTAKLAEYKSTLRERMLESPLCDVNQFAPQFLAALKGLTNSPA